MKSVFRAAVFIAVGLLSTASFAKDLPAGGMTIDELVKWLQDGGYKAEIQTAEDGTKSIHSSADGTGFNIDLYDCKNTPRCGSIEFSVGFDTKGAWNATKMNEWNSKNRWVRAYVSDKDDPWAEMDVDLTPGGTYENLDDEFSVWRDLTGSFKKFIDWKN
jgi:hypothetical protein